MAETVKIGNSWYVVEDICGIVGPQPNILNPNEPLPAKLLMRGGHILSMTDLGEDVIEHIRTLRDPRPNSPTPPVAEFEAVPPGNAYELQQANPAVTDVDMAPADDIPT